MGYSCCVPSCRTGYKLKKGDRKGSIPKVPLFKFPNEQSLKEKWIEAIPRKHWTVSINHRVCAKHFSPDDLSWSSKDTNTTRRSLREIQTLSRIRPKPGVVPHIFHAPSKNSNTTNRKTQKTNFSPSLKRIKEKSARQTNSNLLSWLQDSDLFSVSDGDDSSGSSGTELPLIQDSRNSSVLNNEHSSMKSGTNNFSKFQNLGQSPILNEEETSLDGWSDSDHFSHYEGSRNSPIPDKEASIDNCRPSHQKKKYAKTRCSRSKHFSHDARPSMFDEEESTASCGNKDQSSHSQEVKTLSQLKDEIRSVALPSEYTVVSANDSLQFHFIEISENMIDPPNLAISVIVTESLELFAFVKSKTVPRCMYEEILPSGLVQNTSQVIRVLAVCMRLHASGDHESGINFAVSLLEDCLSVQTNSIVRQNDHICLLRFIIEQLKLTQTRLQDCRYSTDTLLIAFLWRLISPALYIELGHLFALPSMSRLDQLSCEMDAGPRVIDLDHIREQATYLNTQERIVTLIVDVVCTARRLDHGFNDNCNRQAKTVLTFTVQSLYSRYREIVCLIPIERINTSLLRKWFEFVMQALDEFFLVIAVSTGNHVCNRELFTDLCGGELRTSIEHPILLDEKLFLVHDFTHNLINIYDDFVNKRQMDPPTLGHENILGESSLADLDHIISLYGLEEGDHLKKSFLLREESFGLGEGSGANFASPRDALCVFSESTVCGLEAVGKRFHPEFLGTARFVKFIETIWKIMSVKNISKVTGKRNPYSMPLQEMENGHPGEIYLTEAITIFEEWQQSGRKGLASKTFTTCIQTLTAVLALSKYLQRRHGMKYFLTGKVISDPCDVRSCLYQQADCQ